LKQKGRVFVFRLWLSFPGNITNACCNVIFTKNGGKTQLDLAPVSYNLLRL
jgi:hypothetical protein